MPDSGYTISEASLFRRSMPTLHFHPVDEYSLRVLCRFLPWTATRSCDYTVGGIAMWSEYFKYEYAVCNDTLFIKGLSQDGSGRTAFMLPCGRMSLAESFGILRRYCRAKGLSMLFTAVPDDLAAQLRVFNPISIEELPRWADYIYSAEALASLVGKAYNKKRNHVNRFVLDNPDWQLQPVDADTMPGIFELLGRIHNIESKADPGMAAYELAHCRRALMCYADMAFVGAVLIDRRGNTAAFTAGEISGDTLILHIEKADHDVPGAGEAVNRFFAQKIITDYPQIKFINREDDSGDPGLQQAKQSYKPVYLLGKYNINFG